MGYIDRRVKILIIIGILVISVLSALFIGGMRNTKVIDDSPTATIGENTFRLEVADSDSKRTQGLSGRASLDIDMGMLFLMEYRNRYVFWMKEMLFPIDILWIDGDTIVDISKDVPIPESEDDIPRVQPLYPVDKVLEINAGEAERLGIVVGDRVITKNHR